MFSALKNNKQVCLFLPLNNIKVSVLKCLSVSLHLFLYSSICFFTTFMCQHVNVTVTQRVRVYTLLSLLQPVPDIEQETIFSIEKVNFIPAMYHFLADQNREVWKAISAKHCPFVSSTGKTGSRDPTKDGFQNTYVMEWCFQHFLLSH
ncbi:hypothetical protein ILYODFUR_036915 [Ilyodon furcidens]|uniref:Uncharacterized protein n=1 Tax=Ilyodon furcidens TaxID=33524 RepID=A0ABV0TPY4_9TELE